MLVLDKTRSLPADIANAFNKITTPVAASFLAYSRLHNKTVDENNFFLQGNCLVLPCYPPSSS